ncbi:polysaccharide deacetylase, partial [Rhizobium ruizarguesonis]
MSRSLLSACLSVSLLIPAMAEAADRPKQLVIISFDGAHDNALWLKSREMVAKNGAHFTYFLSCTFLMNEAA